MTSRSWQHISSQWDAGSNHSAINGIFCMQFPGCIAVYICFVFTSLWVCDDVACQVYVWFKYDLGQKYYAPQVQASWDSNSWSPYHDSTSHVTETPALTTWPSVSSPCLCCISQTAVRNILIKFSFFASYLHLLLALLGSIITNWLDTDKYCCGLRVCLTME